MFNQMISSRSGTGAEGEGTLGGSSAIGREEVLESRDGVRCTSEDFEVRASLAWDGAPSVGKVGALRLQDGGTMMVSEAWAAGV
jgi:hypothetical protein